MKFHFSKNIYKKLASQSGYGFRKARYAAYCQVTDEK
jgi:DNA polymerase III alpha subunit